MNTAITKKPTMLRLDPTLVERLKEMAKREHRSLNNFVECVLLDVVYNTPNAETASAIDDALKGRFLNGRIDPTSVDSLLKSAGL